MNVSFALFAPAAIILALSVVQLIRAQRELAEAMRLLAKVRELHRQVFEREPAP